MYKVCGLNPTSAGTRFWFVALRLGSRFADPVVLVNTRPSEGERGSIGSEAFLA